MVKVNEVPRAGFVVVAEKTEDGLEGSDDATPLMTYRSDSLAIRPLGYTASMMARTS